MDNMIRFIVYLGVNDFNMKRHSGLTFLLAVFLLFTAASEIVLVRFNAQVQASVTTEIMLSWVVSKEEQVDYYIVKRKMSHQNEFQDIATVQLSNGRDELDGRFYEFTDRNVFKQSSTSEPVIYSLYAFSNGSARYVSQVDVNYTTTAVRRTWGSIKAMFQ